MKRDQKAADIMNKTIGGIPKRAFAAVECDEDKPQLNAQRLRAIAKISASRRINIDTLWALKIADQLELLASLMSVSGEKRGES